ncbi:hypothetical protein TNIN_31441 [Trichonephila inaurata madagascariensis]|uniref:Uncharacterized protein n=1 Tax=Trichonephila inaurata madagascariensis TaxID=2747483 RepID=A0A8X6Y8K2_9ARAC|nr:hypothetical protein TNIN_31441 [Trichonephila inaurata madagascariensis]
MRERANQSLYCFREANIDAVGPVVVEYLLAFSVLRNWPFNSTVQLPLITLGFYDEGVFVRIYRLSQGGLYGGNLLKHSLTYKGNRSAIGCSDFSTFSEGDWFNYWLGGNVWCSFRSWFGLLRGLKRFVKKKLILFDQ